MNPIASSNERLSSAACRVCGDLQRLSRTVSASRCAPHGRGWLVAGWEVWALLQDLGQQVWLGEPGWAGRLVPAEPSVVQRPAWRQCCWPGSLGGRAGWVLSADRRR